MSEYRSNGFIVAHGCVHFCALTVDQEVLQCTAKVYDGALAIWVSGNLFDGEIGEYLEWVYEDLPAFCRGERRPLSDVAEAAHACAQSAD